MTDAKYVMRCANPACHRGFQVNRFAASSAAPPEAGKVVCPHCNESLGTQAGFIFITHALSRDEEAAIENLPAAALHTRSAEH